MKRDSAAHRPADLRRRIEDLRSRLAQASMRPHDYATSVALAEEARILNNEAADRRSTHPEGWAIWLEAEYLRWDAWSAAWPPGFREDVLPRLRAGDPEAVGPAIAFLEADPYFFHSGYAKEEIIRGLDRMPLAPAQEERLRRVVLATVDGPDRREFRRYCRLARKADSPALRAQLAGRLESDDPVIRRHARWVVESLGPAG